MMLIHADPIKAELISQFQFADIAIVELGADGWIETVIGDRDPCGIIFIRLGDIEFAIRHEMEEIDLHHFAPLMRLCMWRAISMPRSWGMA